jgi:hypothetical protein
MQRTPESRQQLRAKIDCLTDDEASEVLDYISVMQSLNESSGPDPLDELILRLLSEADPFVDSKPEILRIAARARTRDPRKGIQ